MKPPSVRRVAWSVVFGCAVLTAVVVVLTLPGNFPNATVRIGDRISAVLAEITLPIKIANLSLQKPDEALLMPVYGMTVSRVSNTWQAPRGTDRVHDGQDIFSPRGTPVFSATRGYVRRAGVNTLGGNYVMITGAGGRRYYYAHFDRIAEGIEPGAKVTTDTVLGFVGNTGNAVTTPPHLHFGVYEGRTALNPLPLLVDRP